MHAGTLGVQRAAKQKRLPLACPLATMSVLFETSLGDLVIDLETELCPKTCENFLKLCKVYYYNLNAFFNGESLFLRVFLFMTLTRWLRPVSKDFLAQVGDPTATGTGGESIWSLIASQNGGPSAPRYFTPEFVPRLKHRTRGTVSMAVAPAAGNEHQGGCGSQFFITLADNIEYLDGKHAVFGHVVEGLDTLEKLNEIFVDQDGRPFKDVRIRHVEILGAWVCAMVRSCWFDLCMHPQRTPSRIPRGL